ncbi:hypothetical protein NDA12_005860 [Ustilago hordei]|nr:hypothetical protein NDA15_005154 [Ustilago hordei]KAJ1574820.1 hypothetical protein NDA12_005860 [Ustilago hordei]
MMASTSPPSDAAIRPDASSRRSISSQAASASLALSSAASTSVSLPYPRLPSSSSSSTSLSTPRRRSFAPPAITVSPSASSRLVADHIRSHPPRRTGSTSSNHHTAVPVHVDVDVDADADADTSTSTIATTPPPAITPAKATHFSPRHQRHYSAETLQLDLDGLDLGGNAPHSPISTNTAGQRRLRSPSNNAPLSSSKQPFAMLADVDPFCTSCASQARTHKALHTLEDSFTHHLRAECSDYREIMSSQVVLNAAADKQRRLQQAQLDAPEAHPRRRYSISHGQVLGGFASLGLQTESPVEPLAPAPQQPLATLTNPSTQPCQAPLTPLTPIEWRDSFGSFGTSAAAPVSSTSPKWAHLTARPCNPLEPLDVLSIQEMGFHSLDIGSLNDWEGCKLSAEILCPLNGHQRIQWSVAQTTRRNNKWVVVPNATLTCGNLEHLTSSEQAERTVIVSAPSLWLQEGQASAAAAPHREQAQAMPPAAVRGLSANHPSSMPFSGKAGFELRLLRPTAGSISPPVYLANASTHRFLHQYRKHNNRTSSSQLDKTCIANASAAPQSSVNASAAPQSSVNASAAPQSSVKASQPVYPVLRRSRSRPYLRHSAVPLRRSRSKPYLGASAQQRQAAEGSTASINAQDFAPSLPGDPLARMHPGESWPSARSRHSDSLSSFDSATTSDADSDTSDDDEHAALSTSNLCERGNKDHTARSNSIPMASAGRAKRSHSPSSSASRGISSTSETSAAWAGWQDNSLESQRFQQQSNGSASYEAESWQGTSPTTASTSSASASSKQSRSRKGLQRALQKKDKMLNSWFKRRPEHTAASHQNHHPEMPHESVSCPAMSRQRQISAGSSLARDNDDASRVPASTLLTENALEIFQRSMFRPASPDSTIMGSRRGSEALTQKTIEPAAGRNFQDKIAATDDGFASKLTPKQAHTDRIDNRVAVNSTLTELYGWNGQEATSKLLCATFAGTALSATGSALQDLDEQSVLLGLDAVPAEALTMLIPLPLIGRSTAQDAVRYMRVNFVPFGSFADPFEAGAGGSGATAPNTSSPVNESESGLSHSTSTGSSSFGSHRDGLSTSFTSKSTEHASNWKRKLGLRRDPITAQTQQRSDPTQPQSRTPAAFRITAIVHDAPWATRISDPRLPEPGTFPVVLGYCNGSKGLEMVPEGWGALKLAGVAEPTKADGTKLDEVHPLKGVTDLIVAACTAVMDV